MEMGRFESRLSVFITLKVHHWEAASSGCLCAENREETGLLRFPQQATLSKFQFPSGGAMLLTKLQGLALIFLIVASTAFGQTQPKKALVPAGKAQAKGAATVAEAEAFMKNAEAQLEDLSVRVNRAGWVQENFITDDTEIIGAQAQERVTAVTTHLALEARRFEGLKMPPELARKFKLLKLSLVAPAPDND